MSRRRRRLSAWALAALLGATGAPALAAVSTQCPKDTDGVDTDGDGKANNDHVCLHLTAGDGFSTMADGRPLYTFGFSDVTGVPDKQVMNQGMLQARLPAPTLDLREGQRVFLNLTNVGMMMRPDLFDPHTVHWHGYANASATFDGLPEASFGINMGATLTYFYVAPAPGTYMYHCHVEAAEHIQMGMVGSLYVRPRQDGQRFEYPVGSGRFYTRFAYNDGDGSTGYDVAYPLQLQAFDPVFHDASENIQPLPFALMHDTYPMLNGRGYPATVNPAVLSNFNGAPSQPVSSLIQATRGQRILLRVSSLATTEFYTLTAVGLPLRVVGKDARQLRGPAGEDLSYLTTSITLGGGESYEVIIDTADVPEGTYFLYSSNLNQLSNGDEDYGGLMTEVVVGGAAIAKTKPARPVGGKK